MIQFLVRVLKPDAAPFSVACLSSCDAVILGMTLAGTPHVRILVRRV